ncbi:MAG: exopolysaccharide Pel transporter PelG [Clostridia bacterium]|nr:exopolysaccharide Pel transporter PelG [Clostridia bacterium]
MAGVGIKLNRIFNKRSLMSSLYGVACSISYTIAPMLVVIGCLLLMFTVLGFDSVGMLERELFSCTILYIFIFALLSSSPFNSVLSKYMADHIYTEDYDDIRPCIFFGLGCCMVLAALLGIPFYLHVYFKGGVPAYYVFTSFMCFLALALVFCSMIFNSILKAYKFISIYFVLGMLVTFLLSLLFHFVLRMSITYSMLLALTIGFLLIAILQMSHALKYFKNSSHRFRPVARTFKRYWKLVAANFLYTFGLFAHNFVFWTHPWRMIIVNSYVCNQPYDMATCIAMFTNISATTFFISKVEMHFHEHYADYMNAVIGGKLDTIEKAKNRMFRTLSNQLLTLVRLQFCVSIVIFLLANIFLPILGCSGITMQIYSLMAVGYFMSFLYYSLMLYLYYFNDLSGAAISALIFAGVTVIGSFISMHLPVIWYGLGFTLASLAAFSYSYFRLRWIEKRLDHFIFCRGSIMEKGAGKKPSSLVFSR